MLPRAPPGNHQPLCGGDEFLTQNVTPPPPPHNPTTPPPQALTQLPQEWPAGKMQRVGRGCPQLEPKWQRGHRGEEGKE